MFLQAPHRRSSRCTTSPPPQSALPAQFYVPDMRSFATLALLVFVTAPLIARVRNLPSRQLC